LMEVNNMESLHFRHILAYPHLNMYNKNLLCINCKMAECFPEKLTRCLNRSVRE